MIRFWWCHNKLCPLYNQAVQKIIGTCECCGSPLHCATVDEADNQVVIK